MRQIEPTYLRFIHDALAFNTIHKDNISALPEGLIGMYEEAFSNDQNVSSKARFIKFFAAWSLLKKEVSTSLMADLLDSEEWEVIDFISVYTKWFNSPSSGKYLLYHERLRVFFLQKISSDQLNQTNQTIISKCQLALELRNGDEWEVYALKHLPSHLLVAAMQSESDGVVFKKLVYDTTFWSRQLEISKGYEWSKRMLNQSMTWAAKQNTDELIECALNKIDLHHMEQNDAPRIVELVAQNDIETALQRIESFGGNDKEGLKRKFITYMLCLMELTLLDSKDKPFRRDAIEKIIKHFDENMPVDHSILNWNDFFSSYLMFLISYECSQIDIDWLIVYTRTRKWDTAWISLKGSYNEKQINILLRSARCISIELIKSEALKLIAIELANESKIEESTKLIKESLISAHNICDEMDKCSAFSAIAAELANQGNIEESTKLIEETLRTVNKISDEGEKSTALSLIAIQQAKQGKIEDSLITSRNIKDESDRSSTLTLIASELAKQGDIEQSSSVLEESLSTIRLESNEFLKSKVLNEIVAELFKQGKIEESSKVQEESLSIARSIIDMDHWKTSSLIAIVSELANQGKIEQSLNLLDESLKIANVITDNYWKSSVLTEISVELARQGKIEQSSKLLEESLKTASLISDESAKSWVLKGIATELLKQGNIEKSMKIANVINNESDKISVLKEALAELAKYEKLIEITEVLEEYLSTSHGFINDYWRSLELKEVGIELAKKGEIEESLKIIRSLNSEYLKCSALRLIAAELATQGKIEDSLIIIEESINIARIINDENDRYSALTAISAELAKQGKIEESLSEVSGISSNYWQSSALTEIASELATQGNVKKSSKIIEESLKTARGESDNYGKSKALVKIGAELAKQGKIEASLKVIEESLFSTRDISEEWSKSIALTEIAAELSKQGNITESINIAHGISDDYVKTLALTEIAAEMVKQGMIEESLNIAFGLKDESNFSFLLRKIATALVKQENWSLAEKTGLLIPLIYERQCCWKEIAAVILDHNSWQKSFKEHSQFSSDEARLFYLKGWAENINVIDINDYCIYKTLHIVYDDIDNLEKILLKYAANQVFFNTTFRKNYSHLNRTLNIQWVLDIKNQFM
jgi:tetratricopeptide (TPR) repeat protein